MRSAMYKLMKGEGLYRVSDDKYIVATHVESEVDKTIVEFRTEFRGKQIVRRTEYKPGEIGIFWLDDTKELCSRPLRSIFDIYYFHEDLYAHGFLEDDIYDFATADEIVL